MEGPTHTISPSMVAPGAVLAGKYRVERLLGEGGMGVVIAAHHIALDQRVAIKLLRGGGLDRPDVVERFIREARNVVRLRSHHVAKVFDVGTLETGWPYIVLEYLEGHDLDHVIRHEGALTYERAVGLVLQACEAVAEAHALGIIHRDIKPHNLFLTTGFGGSDLLKVLDFGIAKSTAMQGSALTRTDNSVGSPLYMSPEQMRSPRDVDARTDIWSLGVTMYELLSGRAPFEAETFAELVLKVTGGTFTPLSQVVRAVPHELSEVISKCLTVDREARWANVADLASALEPFASPDARPLAENARRAYGKAPSNRSLAASSPAPSTRDPSPATLKETELATGEREKARLVQTPGQGVAAVTPGAHAPAAVPFGMPPLTGTGASGPNAWSGSASSDVPQPPKRSPLLAVGLAAFLLVGGASALLFVFGPSGAPRTPAGSGLAPNSSRADAAVEATSPPLSPLVSASTSATATSPSAPRPPQNEPAGKQPRGKPSASVTPPPPPPVVAKEPDGIPAER